MKIIPNIEFNENGSKKDSKFETTPMKSPGSQHLVLKCVQERRQNINT